MARFFYGTTSALAPIRHGSMARAAPIPVDQLPGAKAPYNRPTKKGPLAQAPFRSPISAGSATMAMWIVVMRIDVMAAIVPINTVTDKPDRLQVNTGDAGGDVQTRSGLAAADKLQA